MLAFANLTDDKDNEYFSDGISGELLNVLSRVQELKVSALPGPFVASFESFIGKIGHTKPRSHEEFKKRTAMWAEISGKITLPNVWSFLRGFAPSCESFMGENWSHEATKPRRIQKTNRDVGGDFREDHPPKCLVIPSWLRAFV